MALTSSRSNSRARSPCSASAATSGRLTRSDGPAAAIGASVSEASSRVRSYRSRWSRLRWRSSAAVMRRGGSMTATPMSSTLAAGSNSSVTPNSPIAG